MPAVTPSPGLNFDVWEEELTGDSDRDFILNGISNGFDIVSTETNNNISARPGAPMYEQASKQILAEITEGNYVVCDDKPAIISPLSVIPKPDGGVRLIHDASQPKGGSMNDYAKLETHYRFQTVDDATKLMWPGYYIAKVDLKAAYRSVSISNHSQQFTGLKWLFDGQPVYFKDTKLPFGPKLAPGIFHRITQSVRRIMHRKGHTDLVVYRDDFFIISPSRAECQHTQMVLITLLRKLGFQISWSKVVDPTQSITLLGIELDTVNMCSRIPTKKLEEIRQKLLEFSKRRRASKRQLQSLVGVMNWAAAVIYGGRVFLRRVIDLTNTLRQKMDRVLLSSDMRHDIEFWLEFMTSFNGKSAVLDKQPITTVYTDACMAGCGGVYGNDWFYCNWALDWSTVDSLHINHKELLAVVLAAARWAPMWSGKRIYIMSDNQATVAMINKGSTKHPVAMEALRCLFWLSASYGFHLTGRYVPGTQNVAADSASRLLELGQLDRLLNNLPINYIDVISPPLHVPLYNHVSARVFNYCYFCR